MTRLARGLTEVLTPVVPVLVICILCGLHSQPGRLAGLGWGLFAGLFCAAIPYVIVEAGVRRARFSDRQVSRPEQRRRAYLLGIGSVVVGLAAMLLLGAPVLLLWALGTMCAGLLLAAGITLLGIKVSLHLFCLSALLAFLALLLDPRWLLAAPVLLPLLGWARLHLAQHTLREVVLGTLLGPAVTLLGWSLAPLPGG
ncbi:hypothetical protein [Brachybacterium hainanense]|uniref:Uncharacterized protein n=1 Tax=Brachybacterium hainanense TaxID=1541174 RepID=A0ABV6RGR7_9MICO